MVGDIFIIPEDPLGRDGPTLEQFLYMPSADSSVDTTAAAARQFFEDRLDFFSFSGQSAFSVLWGLRFSRNPSVSAEPFPDSQSLGLFAITFVHYEVYSHLLNPYKPFTLQELTHLNMN
jgi:hypothetical protein